MRLVKRAVVLLLFNSLNIAKCYSDGIWQLLQLNW